VSLTRRRLVARHLHRALRKACRCGYCDPHCKADQALANKRVREQDHILSFWAENVAAKVGVRAGEIQRLGLMGVIDSSERKPNAVRRRKGFACPPKIIWLKAGIMILYGP
jgi:hypothetical protein